MSTHTCRRSGASELSRMRYSMVEIMGFGRWASDRAAREYIRPGEVAVARATATMGAITQNRMLRWESSASTIWDRVEALHTNNVPLLKLDVKHLSVETIRVLGNIFVR